MTKYDSRMTVLQRPAVRLITGPEVAFPTLALGLTIAFADIRIPLGLPGHRGLIWLTLLVAVALVTRRRETVIAVGAAATIATLGIHGLGAPLWSARYVDAAILLYATACLPAVVRRPWLLALAAGPIHLVALATTAFAPAIGGHLSTWASGGLVEKATWHLAFGLMAGGLAWLVAVGMAGMFGKRK